MNVTYFSKKLKILVALLFVFPHLGMILGAIIGSIVTNDPVETLAIRSYKGVFAATVVT